MYESTSADLGQQLLISFFYAVYGALFVYKNESIVVSSVVRAVMCKTNICFQSVEQF